MYYDYNGQCYNFITSIINIIMIKYLMFIRNKYICANAQCNDLYCQLTMNAPLYVAQMYVKKK